MSDKTEDRRVRRTRRLLGDALMELMLRKRYDRITVQDIIDRADVGRATFYAHCRNKQDLLLDNFRRALDAISQRAETAPGGDPAAFPTLGYFRHAREHLPLYRALVRGRAADLLFRTAYEHLSRRFEAHLASLAPAGPAPALSRATLAELLAGTFLTHLRWWLEHDLPHSAEQMDALFQELVLPGVQSVLNRRP